jgi:hypothetical protein
MKPLRRKKTCEVTDNPITGQDRILELMQEEDILSDQGSVDSAGVHRRYIRDCGCDGPVGGRCFECGGISCNSCHGRCQNCQKPICLEHSNFSKIEGKGEIRLCNRCFDSITRKQKLTKVARFFLSVFVQTEAEHE